MALEEKLAAIREMAKSHPSPEVRAVMHRATEDLRASGIMNGVAKVGAPEPDFTLSRAADADADYTRRPEPEQSVEVLRRLGR